MREIFTTQEQQQQLPNMLHLTKVPRIKLKSDDKDDPDEGDEGDHAVIMKGDTVIPKKRRKEEKSDDDDDESCRTWKRFKSRRKARVAENGLTSRQLKIGLKRPSPSTLLSSTPLSPSSSSSHLLYRICLLYLHLLLLESLQSLAFGESPLLRFEFPFFVYTLLFFHCSLFISCIRV